MTDHYHTPTDSRTVVKLPRFDGTAPLEPYLAKVELAAEYNGWRLHEAAVHLSMALEGEALKVLPREER